MSEAEGNPARPPRFPYVGALLCVACLGAAFLLWLLYSHTWHLTSREVNRMPGYGVLTMGASMTRSEFRKGRYVKVAGAVTEEFLPPGWIDRILGDDALVALVMPGAAQPVWIISSQSEFGSMAGASVSFHGRLYVQSHSYEDDSQTFFFFVDGTAGRFTGASVAGLAVGAMGVFVFAVAFRDWLKERRRFRDGAAAA